MRVGINCLRIDPGYKGGVNSFTFGLIDGFAASRRGHEFVIFAGQFNRHIFARYETLSNFRVVQIDDLTPSARQRPVRGAARKMFYALPWWIRYRLPLLYVNRWLNEPYDRQMSEDADVIFTPYAPSPLFPFPDTPTLYSIHDLQHIHFSQFFTPEQMLEREANFATAVEHAAMIQATTRQMRDEFLEHFPTLTADRVVIIPEGVDVDSFVQNDFRPDVRERYSLPKHFAFYPAQLWHHKNHITILKALARLKEQGTIVPLVLTGARYSASQPLFDFIVEHDLTAQVFYLGLVPYEDVIALYRAARFLVTASLYEAGSIPMLEAAAAGTPIIGSAIPSHTEHSEELRMQLFLPTNDAALAELIARVWDDDALIASQVKFNNKAIQKFTWKNAAERYLDAFESMVRGGNG
jgi:glycosyltransferase involved in cell wall biosynthesis